MISLPIQPLFNEGWNPHFNCVVNGRSAHMTDEFGIQFYFSGLQTLFPCLDSCCAAMRKALLDGKHSPVGPLQQRRQVSCCVLVLGVVLGFAQTHLLLSTPSDGKESRTHPFIGAIDSELVLSRRQKTRSVITNSLYTTHEKIISPYLTYKSPSSHSLFYLSILSLPTHHTHIHTRCVCPSFYSHS